MHKRPQLLGDLHKTFCDPIDLFICSASFEQRCLSISMHLERGGVENVAVLRNLTHADENDESYHLLNRIWGGKAEEITISSDDPVMSCDNINDLLTRRSRLRPKRVLIDISTLTHEHLIILCNVVATTFTAIDDVVFVYATADDYSVGEEGPKKWLSKGVKEIRSVIGYPGKLVPSRDTHLILMAGYEEYRAHAVITELEPSLLSIGYGDKSEESTKPHQETNETKVRRLRSLVGDVNQFVFSCYDPKSTAATLSKLISKHQEFNHIIAPMNTKLSTVGAVYTATSDESVQLCYAQPEVYNFQNYSVPGTHFYCFRFKDVFA